MSDVVISVRCFTDRKSKFAWKVTQPIDPKPQFEWNLAIP